MAEIIIIIILIVVVCIAWLAWTEQKSKQALDKDVLDQAWREVLDDPHSVTSMSRGDIVVETYWSSGSRVGPPGRAFTAIGSGTRATIPSL